MESPETSEAIGSILSSLGMDYGGKIYDLAIYSGSMLNRLLGPADNEYQRVIIAQRREPGQDSIDPGIIKAILAAIGHTKVANVFMSQTTKALADPLTKMVGQTMGRAASAGPVALLPKLKGLKVPLKIKSPGVPKVKPPTVSVASNPVGKLRPGTENPFPQAMG